MFVVLSKDIVITLAKSISSMSNKLKREFTPLVEAEQRNKLQRINFESFFKPVDERNYKELLAPYRERKFRECVEEHKFLIACFMNHQPNEWPEEYTTEELELADEWCERWAPKGEYKDSPTIPVDHVIATSPLEVGFGLDTGEQLTADGTDWDEFWNKSDTVAKLDAWVEDYKIAQRIQRAAIYQVKRRERNAIKVIAVREELNMAEASAKYRERRAKKAIDYKRFGTDGAKIKKIKDQEQRELQVIADTLMEDAPEEDPEDPTPEVVYVKIDIACDECGQTFTTTAEEGFTSHVGNWCNVCLVELRKIKV